MPLLLADTFTSSLARLTGDEQKAVKTTAFDLQMNPANPGMKFHRLDKARDRNFWSVRVNSDIRLIVHKTDASLLLCYVDHHDAAYTWAERRKLERHPVTGAMQMVEIRETVREIEIPRYVEPPREEPPPPGPKKYWTRVGLAEWLTMLVSEDIPAIVGMDHGFSFPMKYFDKHGLPHHWEAFLDDFERHWPTRNPHTYVDFIRDGAVGGGHLRTGMRRWRRVTEERAGSAKSVFHFDVQGSVAKSTHAGLPWLRHIAAHASPRPHFWPFDGWDVAPARSAIVEVYPRLWTGLYPVDNRNSHQHDAFAVASWLRDADTDGRLTVALLGPSNPSARAAASAEGWILGVE